MISTRLTPGCYSQPWATRENRGARREEREKRKEKVRIWLWIFPKNLNCARKTLNMKVVQNFISYNFRFRQNFIWALVCKLISNSYKKDKMSHFKFKFNSNFCVAIWKFLNIKVVQQLKLYHFCVRQKFIWAKIYKIFSKAILFKLNLFIISCDLI